MKFFGLACVNKSSRRINRIRKYHFIALDGEKYCERGEETGDTKLFEAKMLHWSERLHNGPAHSSRFNQTFELLSGSGGGSCPSGRAICLLLRKDFHYFLLSTPTRPPKEKWCGFHTQFSWHFYFIIVVGSFLLFSLTKNYVLWILFTE